MADLVFAGLEGEWPYNFCMSEFNAAAARIELKRLDEVTKIRQRQARRLVEGLADLEELTFQKVAPGCEHVYHLMTVRYDGSATGKTRDDVIDIMFNEHDIKCYVHYMPLYRFDLFRKMGCGEADCPVSDRYYESMYGYPWWTGMDDALLDRFVESTRKTVMKLRG